MDDFSVDLRRGCHVFGLEVPCGFTPLGFSEFFSTTAGVFCVFPICVSKKLERYFLINYETLFKGNFWCAS